VCKREHDYVVRSKTLTKVSNVQEERETIDREIEC